MSKPMTPDQVVAQFKKFNVPFREIEGWRTHNRNQVGDWGPVYGFGVHHTGDDAPDVIDRRIIRDGRSGLPGPLSQFGLNDDGVVDLIGHGRANHFGGGDPAVLEAVKNESYKDYPPAPKFHTGQAGAADGNTHFYGVETYYSGGEPPTRRARKSLVSLAAAICDFHDWSAKSVIGHKEWSNWKSDPGHLDMKTFRADVTAEIALVNAVKPPAPTTPNITAALKAQTLAKRIIALKAVQKDGGTRAQAAAEKWLNAIAAKVAAEKQAVEARASLEKLEK